jgi:hypothetical protein
MPMRFAASDGTMIDVYQAVTQLTDESGITYSTHISSLLDKALGPEGYYGAFTANMHTDSAPHAGSDAIVGAALLRHVPVISAKQLLTWLDGRNGSTFGGLTWSNNRLAFRIDAASGADGMQAMVPTTSIVGPLIGITFDGSAISFTRQTIKGIEYAIFAANAGTYSASYVGYATSPDTVITASPGSITNSTNAAFSFVSTKGDGTFACSLDSSAFVPCSSPKTYVGLSSRSHQFVVRAIDMAGIPDPTPASHTWTISNVVFRTITDATAGDFSAGTPGTNTYIAQPGQVILAPVAGAEFFDSTMTTGWFSSLVAANGSVSFDQSGATLDGALIGTNSFYTPGVSLEFMATFSGDFIQHIGFGQDFSSGTPYAIFSTYPGGGLLYARFHNGLTDDLMRARYVAIPGSWLNAPHRFRIDWSAGSVNFFIDGSLVVAVPFSTALSMRPLVADATPANGGALSLNWIRMMPYARSGTFLSRVFDAGATTTWGTFSWTGTTPPVTTFAVSVRQGNTPVPDISWSAFTLLGASGGALTSTSRYLQYSAQLTTTDPTQTPALNSVAITYISRPDTPGALDAGADATVITAEPAR